MSFFEFPHTRTYDTDLGWLIKTVNLMNDTLKQFVSLNTIKYANPIQWDITTQYETNTVVIDPISGVAYISVQPVPSGVNISNTDYWTVIFDLGAFVIRAAKNFTNRFEAETTLTATFPSNVGDWLVWGDVLYEVISPIIAGDQYVENSNIKHITMEEVVNTLVQAIDDVDNKIGDLDDLTTVVKTSVVDAINEIVSNIGDLSTLTTSDITSIVNAINSEVTDRTNADTLILNQLNNLGLVSVKDYGAVGDGVTDDSQAFIDAINDAAYGEIILIPKGNYKIDSVITVGVGKRVVFIGECGDANGSTILYSTSGAFDCSNEGVSFYRVCFRPQTTHPASGVCLKYSNCYRVVIEDCNFIDGFIGIDYIGSELNINRCVFIDFTPYTSGNSICLKLGVGGYTAPVQITNCLFRGVNTPPARAMQIRYTDGVIITGCTVNNFQWGIVVETTSDVNFYTFIDNCVLDTVLQSLIAFISNGSMVGRAHVTNCWLGTAATSAILIMSTNASGDVHDIKIGGNVFALNDYDINADASAGGYVGQIDVYDNSFNDTSTRSVRCENVTNVNIHDNSFNTLPVAYGGSNSTTGILHDNDYINVANDDIIGGIFKNTNFNSKNATYTPSVVAETGSINSYTVNKAEYYIDNNVLRFAVALTITDAGTGAGGLIVDLPKTAKKATTVNASVMNRCAMGYINANDNHVSLFSYDGTTLITSANYVSFEGEIDLI